MSCSLVIGVFLVTSLFITIPMHGIFTNIFVENGTHVHAGQAHVSKVKGSVARWSRPITTEGNTIYSQTNTSN